MKVCPACGEENPERARFCLACGTALSEAATEGREERKVVTVLFADLAGFTARAESLDPEDVRSTLGDYHGRVRAELERYGGTVEKFIGDAVVAVFGAPVAHEDDPERAVRAAFAVHDAVARLNAADPLLDLHLRVAVNTGEALVALDARPGEGDAMVSGDVMNTAARLQASAPVDGVLVGEATYRATERTILYEEVPAVEAKGKSQPVPAWRAVEPRSRFGVDFEQAGGAPLFGRQRELDLLLGALARAREERSVQLVTVVGVPGIGKSRLVWELSQVVDRDPGELVYWRQGRSLAYGEGVSFWALGEIVKAHAGILETDSGGVARDKLVNVLVEALADAEEARWIEEHLSTLVGLGEVEATGDRRDEAFAAWRRFFEALADLSPLVLVFEDLQWADDGLLDFVDHLVEWVRDVPMLVLCTARPELLARRPEWGGGKPNAATLSLPPLADEEIEHLLASLLDQPLLPADTQSRLLAHAGGNPLYAEEYVRMLVGAGTPGLELPETVQGIIAARLDALDPAEKLLLQEAAVVGKVVWVGALAAVGGRDRDETEDVLHALERKEFVRRERRSSVAGEGEYAFRHILVRDVAYGQIPRARRAELHERAAAWLESLAADRAEDRAEMLGHHYLAALGFARSAGSSSPELVERARVPLRQAGDRAYGLNAFEAAIGFYEAALAGWPDADPARAEVLLAYGRALVVGGRDAGEEAIAQAVRALLAEDERGLAAEGEVMLGELAWRNARRGEARRRLDRAEQLIDGLPPSRSSAYVLAQLARFEMLAQRREPAVARGREALAAADALGLELLRLHVLITIGTARTISGDLAGLDDLEEAIEVGTRLNTPEVLRAYINLASLRQSLGQQAEGSRLHEEGLRVARRFGVSASIQWLEAEVAADLYYDGRWDEALGRADASISAWPSHYMGSLARVVRAAVWMARGETADALAESVDALQNARGAEDPSNLWPALGFRALMLVRAGRPDEAREPVEELLALVSAADEVVPVWVTEAALALAELGRFDDVAELASRVGLASPLLDLLTALAAGDLVAAADRLGEAGWRGEEATARLRAGEKLLAAGRRPEGEAQLARALDFFRSVRATAYLAEGERLLARSA
ncbi:MAG TPA: AAA family ATPase [Gaiellaceae bacterium]|nr:AAA family ATPase [Gaiellaceae bacterium]